MTKYKKTLVQENHCRSRCDCQPPGSTEPRSSGRDRRRAHPRAVPPATSRGGDRVQRAPGEVGTQSALANGEPLTELPAPVGGGAGPDPREELGLLVVSVVLDALHE